MPENCSGYEMDEDAYRAVGSTLSYYDYHTKAIDYFLLAEECSKTSLGRFYTLAGLGHSYLSVSQYEEAEGALSTALGMQDEILLKEESLELVSKLLRAAYIKLGKTLWATNDDPPRAKDAKRAIHAYEQAISFRGKDTTASQNVALANEICQILLDVDDPKETVDKLFSWDTSLCTSWLLEDLEVENLQEEFQQAAKIEGRVEDLIKCYQAAIEAANEVGGSLMIQVELASIHGKVLDDEDHAYEELRRIMDTTDMSRNGKQARHRASLLLSEMMYGRIKLVPKVWMRRHLAANLAVISQKDTESGLDLWNIRPNISLAAIYLSSNQRQDAVQLLDSTFSLCMEWLRDDVSWNDIGSIRLLSKLLACVGLHRDAEIACSANFSILDLSLDFSDLDLDSDFYSDLDSDLDIGHVDGTAPEDIDHPSTPSQQKDQLSKVPTEEQLITKGLEDTDETVVEHPTEPATTVKEPEYPNNHKRLIPADDEERHCLFTTCNGCKKSFEFWIKEEPLYMCIICQNVDLCKDCYAKRMVLNREGESAIHVTYCGRYHDYVKAPMDGWGGIRDGIMSVGPEKVDFKHWLRDVEQKWGEWKETGKVGL